MLCNPDRVQGMETSMVSPIVLVYTYLLNRRLEEKVLLHPRYGVPSTWSRAISGQYNTSKWFFQTEITQSSTSFSRTTRP